MFNDVQLEAALSCLPRDLVIQVRLLLAEGWPLEAERLLALRLGEPLVAKEIIASMVRRMVTHE